MPKKTTTPKKKTTHKKSAAKARPSRAKAPNKKAKENPPRTRARSKALAKAAREAEEARVAELFANRPRAFAAMHRYLDLSRSHGKDSPEAKQAYRLVQENLEKANTRESPGSLCLPEYTPNDPREPAHEVERDQLHDEVFVGGVYQRMMRPLVEHFWGEASHVSAEICATNVLHTGDVLRQMQPRDPMEKMLVAQALWTHARIAHLTDLAVFEKSYKGIQILNEAIDRAGNVYRRQMLALAEYRRPPRPGGMVNRIHQANIAQEQVVHNGMADPGPGPGSDSGADPWVGSETVPVTVTEEKPTNELGFKDAHTQAALQAQPQGETLATGGDPAEPSVAAGDGAEDPGG